MEVLDPVRVVELVEDAVEWCLVDQRKGGVDGDENDAVTRGVIYQRREDEGLHFLGLQSVSDAIALRS